MHGKDGTLVSEIFVPKGATVIVGFLPSNTNKAVWGEDADKWDPDRFARLDAEKQVKVRVYANL